MSYQVITATLVARTAVHIGSGEGNDLSDALIRRDTKGVPFIPGTAIAGALRSLLTRLAPRLGHKPCNVLTTDEKTRGNPCDCAVCRLFGDANPSDKKGATSAASRILVFNAQPDANNQPKSLVRDGVGIDRITGAAARAGAVKFDLEVLPAGATFNLRMELRDTTNDEDDKCLLAAGLAEWQAGRMWLGGRVARGLGAFELKNLEYRFRELNTPKQVLAFLKDDELWGNASVQGGWLEQQIKEGLSGKLSQAPKNIPAVSRGWVSIEGTLQAEGPLLTNDTLTAGASGFDHAPLLAQWGDWQNPVLTGAGLRGVLRSHTERIARTLATLTAWRETSPEERRKRFLTKCPACSPVESQSDAPLASCDALLKDARFPTSKAVSDDRLCLACRLFGSTRRGSRLIVEDAPYKGEQPPKLKMLDFLAIDRFTGGGTDKLKFDALALWKPAFTLRLHLENPETWELGWLALVLRDLEEGWLSVGFGAAKGFGRVKLQNWTVTFGYLIPEDLPNGLDEPQTPATSGIFKTTQLQSDAWKAVAQSWVDKFYEKVNEFHRWDLLQLKADSYFDKVDKLYPVQKGGVS